MQTRNPVSSANVMGRPLHPILITLPIGLFVATFIFDVIFWQTQSEVWATSDLWLLGFGLIAAALAAVAINSTRPSMVTMTAIVAFRHPQGAAD